MNRVPTGYPRRLMALNAPSNSGSLTCSHLAWPKVLVAAALLLGASVGHTQWLETRITLPDSLGGAILPTCLATDTSERLVYIGDGSGAVYVVDAEARTRLARIPSGFVYAICTNTRRNKVYAADSAGSRVFAISCATNQVVATVSTGARPLALCYNSIDDKVYSANYDGGDLTVIDCSSDRALKTVHLGGNPCRLCYNSASNRVFCLQGDTLAVIDGANDSVVTAYAATWYGPFIVNAPANRVYVYGSESGVLVLDGTTGVVLDSLNACAEVMCLNPRTQKLYTGGKQKPVEIAVFDCTADTLVEWFRLRGDSYIYSMVCDTVADKIYASCDWNREDKLVVIDGATDTIAVQVPGPHFGELLASSGRSKIYATDHYGPELAVFDTGTDSLIRTVFIGGSPGFMCYDSTDDKVYSVKSSILGEVDAINAATNHPVGHIQVGLYPRDIVWHAPTNRVYCGACGDITVIDPAADTVTKILHVAGYLLCSAPQVNKVYACDYGFNVSVIDCRNDSVTKTIVVPTCAALSICYVAHDKLYLGGPLTGALSIIDCVGDTLIRSYPFGNTILAAGRDGKQVYCARPYSLCTFDATGDTLVSDVPWEATGATDLRYIPALNKVYCVCGGNGQDCMLVADGETDSVIAQIPIPIHNAIGLGYDRASGLVYCGHSLDSFVTFFDSRTDSVVTSLNTGFMGRTFVTVSAHNRVYVGGGGNSFVPVIRTDPPAIGEAAQSPTSKKLTRPTIVPRSLPLVVHTPSVLLDAAGRKVLDAKPGLHYLTAFRVGVYFLRNLPDGKVTKILLVD